MCVLLACQDRKPTLEMLEKCDKCNPHGGGFMHFNKDGQVWYKKGLDAKEIFDLVQKIELPFIVHFRWASQGVKDKLLCHPFEVTENSDLKLESVCDKALMHNGTFVDWRICLAAAKLPEHNELMSDTRAIAQIISKDNIDFLKKLNGYFIVADSSRKKFRLFGDFKEDEGIFFSNFIWKYGKTTYYSNHNNNHTVAWDADKELEKHGFVEKKTLQLTHTVEPSKVKINSIAIPTIHIDKTMEMGELTKLIVKLFKSICPIGLSKNKKKRLWNLFCSKNGLYSMSFRLNANDIIKEMMNENTDSQKINEEINGEIDLKEIENKCNVSLALSQMSTIPDLKNISLNPS